MKNKRKYSDLWMFNRTYHLHFPSVVTVLSALIMCIVLFSWIGSIYNLPVQNILNIDGIRWILRYAVFNFTNTPISTILILLLGLGIAYQTKIFSLWKIYNNNATIPHTSLSLKQRRAFVLSIMAVSFYIILIILGTYSPWAILLGITGGIESSPFLDGLPFLVSIGFAIAGIVYGFTSGQMRKSSDIMKGMSSLIIKLAPGIVWIFFICQLLAIIDYTRISDLLSINKGNTLRQILEFIVYYAPFLYYYWR